MGIPCEECLVYAACRNRAYVDCDILYNYLIHIERVECGKLATKYFTKNRYMCRPIILAPTYNDVGVGRVIFQW